MGDVNVEDRVALDRDVARAVAALTRWRRDVTSDPGGAHAEPLAAFRSIAGKSTWDALGALSVNAADEPLQPGFVAGQPPCCRRASPPPMTWP